MTPLQSAAGEDLVAVRVGLTLAYVAVTVGAGVLLLSLVSYVQGVLAASYRRRWAYLAVGVGAAVVYGLSGLLGAYGNVAPARTFQVGATLFFFLFSAVGIRELYYLEHDRPERSDPSTWATYLVLGGFVAVWWASFLLGRGSLLALVETIGLAGATVVTIVFAVLTVRSSEGTSIAAVVRQLLPALLAFAGVVVAEQAGVYTSLAPGVVVGVELVGTALVGAFLFTTAVAIRQEAGEVTRMYDRTTWRGT
ncbi:MAG: hypothetical protein ABEJ22_03490 [Haloferacaceae archaeon]